MSDDRIAEIRARHEQVPSGNLSIAAISLAHDDRALLLAEDERHRAEIERLRKAMTNMMIGWRHIRREREEYRAEVERLRAENERLLQAIGLVTTTVPEMEIDIENPVGMAQRVVAEFKKLREENERLRAAATSAGAALAAAIELLERGREDAPSKRMFSQMLADYRVIVARTRKALEGKP